MAPELWNEPALGSTATGSSLHALNLLDLCRMLSPWFRPRVVGPTEKFRARVLNARGHRSVASYIAHIAFLCVARVFVCYPSTKMSFVCDSRSKAFNSLKALRRHRSSRHSVFPAVVVDGKTLAVGMVDDKYACPCEGCGKVYTNRETMLKHLKEVHSVPLGASSTSLAPVVDVAEGGRCPLAFRGTRVD